MIFLLLKDQSDTFEVFAFKDDSLQGLAKCTCLEVLDISVNQIRYFPGQVLLNFLIIHTELFLVYNF